MRTQTTTTVTTTVTTHVSTNQSIGWEAGERFMASASPEKREFAWQFATHLLSLDNATQRLAALEAIYASA